MLGTLKVNGTAQNPVVMTTSGTRGAWQGIEIRTGSTGSTLTHLQLGVSVAMRTVGAASSSQHQGQPVSATGAELGLMLSVVQ